MDVKKFVKILDKNHRIKKYCGVSDSTLSSLITYLESRGVYQAFTNEGDAVAYAAGQTLGGVPTAVLMQNSGLTNAMSPLTSLVSLYDIPLVCIVGHRGGEKDEPQHKILGASDVSFVNNSFSHRNIPNIIRIKSYIDDIDYRNYCPESSTFYFIDRDAFPRDKEIPEVVDSYEYLQKRSDYIKFLVNTCKNCRFVSTTGYTSRELMKETKNDTENCFYMLGSMGCLISFANGLAQSHPRQRFIALDGDGSFLMRPEGLYMAGQYPSDNLLHIVFVNRVHQSTGGQKLPMEGFDNFIEGAHRCVEVPPYPLI